MIDVIAAVLELARLLGLFLAFFVAVGLLQAAAAFGLWGHYKALDFIRRLGEDDP